MCSFQLVVTVLLFSLIIATELDRSNDEFKALNSNDSELIFTHIVYRHGDRTIGGSYYPNDPWRAAIHWPEGYGSLTNKGKREHYRLGKYFARRYGKLLGDKYTPNQLYVRSTDVDRAIMSALANLAGMFPPKTANEIWNKDLAWQPIPVHTIPLDSDYIVHHGKKCPKFDALSAKHIKESPEIQQIYSQYADHFSHWSQETGKNITTFTHVKGLYKTLQMEIIHNKTILPWAQKAIERNGIMRYISDYYFKLATDTPQLARLSTGFLIKDIFERISQKINKTLHPDRSIYIYSAHDDTVANILNSLGLFEPHIPPYASSVLIELYKRDDGDHYVQFFYRKSDEENPSPLNLPNCGQKCTLDQLYELYSDIIPGDFETECSLP